VTINRPPRDGHMAFVRSPDQISIEDPAARSGPALARPGLDAETWGTGDERPGHSDGDRSAVDPAA